MKRRGITMKKSTLWYRIQKDDPRALEMADRHYSRQTPGSLQFTWPGNIITLMHFLDDGITPAALWAAYYPAGLCTRKDNRDVWDCPMFRVEHRTVLASELIHDAVACIKGLWGNDFLPKDGFYTTVAIDKIRQQKWGTKNQRARVGYCFIKAGWILLPELTKTHKLAQLMLSLDDLIAIEPLCTDVNMPPFGISWRKKTREVDQAQLSFDL